MGRPGLFDDGFRVARSIFGPLAGLTLLVSVPGVLVLAAGYTALPSGVLIDVDIPSFIRVLVLTTFGFLICQSFFEPVLLACAYAAADHAYEGRSWSIGLVLTQVWRRWWAIIVVGALYYGGVYGFLLLAVLGVGAMAAAGFVGVAGELSWALVLGVGGLVLACGGGVAAMVFGVRYGFSLPEVVIADPAAAAPTGAHASDAFTDSQDDGAGSSADGAPTGPHGGDGAAGSSAWEAFARSAGLVRSAYLVSAAVLLVLVAVRATFGFMAAQLVPMPNVLGLDSHAFLDHLPDLLRAQLLQQAITSIVTALVVIYTASCWVVLYHWRRAERVTPTPPYSRTTSPAGTSATPADS